MNIKDIANDADFLRPIISNKINDTFNATKLEKKYKKDKSLELLSIGFLKLFLLVKNMISLDVAAKALSEPNLDEHKIKTKVNY